MGTSSGEFLKYPRTPHIFGSRGTTDDKYLNQADSLNFLKSPDLIIEEKVDGANVSIHFVGKQELILQCRGHQITSGMHPQFDPLKAWTETIRSQLYSIIRTRYLLFGEWLYARHHLFYERLPHYFMEFDIYDKQAGCFLDTPTRKKLLEGSPVFSIAAIEHKNLRNVEDLKSLLGKSAYGDITMEGLYLKIEAEGRVISRAKFVREEFTAEVEALGEHWSRRPLEVNQLLPGISIWA